MQLLKEVKITKVKAGQTSGTTAVVTDVIDMANFEGVVFVGSIATANAGNFVSVQQGMVADGSASADLLGTKVVTGDDADSFAVDVCKPTERYVKATITRTAATITGDVYAIQYGPRISPVASQGATIDAESHVSPAEGTA